MGAIDTTSNQPNDQIPLKINNEIDINVTTKNEEMPIKHNDDNDNSDRSLNKLKPDLVTNLELSVTEIDDDQNISANNKLLSSLNTSFFSEHANAIGCYGKPAKKLKEKMDAENCNVDIFDLVVQQIMADLKLDVFPRFLKSKMFDMYLRCKSLELNDITINSFYSMRMLGRGAFGAVNAC